MPPSWAGSSTKQTECRDPHQDRLTRRPIRRALVIVEPMTGIEPAYSAWEVDSGRCRGPPKSTHSRDLGRYVHVSPPAAAEVAGSCDTLVTPGQRATVVEPARLVKRDRRDFEGSTGSIPVSRTIVYAVHTV